LPGSCDRSSDSGGQDYERRGITLSGISIHCNKRAMLV
jgi:hypothetical protein